MKKSNSNISQRANKVAASGFLDLLGEDINNYGVPTLDNVQNVLYNLAALYVQTAVDNLNKADRVGAGILSDSIVASPVQILGKVYSVEISLASYYKFVDQGVNGWNQSQGSQFNFKHYTGKSGKKSSAMVAAIQKWLISEGLQATAVNAKKTPFNRERKQASITDRSLGAAISITKAIRKRGLKASHFWTDAEATVAKSAQELFSEAIRVDIIESLSGKG